jgi:hypothetical protein
MKPKKNYKLTSVKVDVDNYLDFKMNNVVDGISFQTLVNETLELYKSSEKFREWFVKSQNK